MIAVLASKVWKYVVGILAALVVFASVFFAGRKSGETRSRVEAAETVERERRQIAEALAEQRVKEVKIVYEKEKEDADKVSEVSSSVDAMSSSVVADRLRDKWSRD